jgi:hypothetical protein
MEPDSIVNEARAAVAAGREPDWDAFERRVREASPGPAEQRRALDQLARIRTVSRARDRVARPPEPPAPRAPVRPRGRPAALTARPTLSGTIDVRREVADGEHLLRWPPDRLVETWEVRFGVRADARSVYVDGETLTLPGEATSIALPLGEGALRVHLLGRGRGGRLVRRALASGLTRDTWEARWQRRPSAA